MKRTLSVLSVFTLCLCFFAGCYTSIQNETASETAETTVTTEIEETEETDTDDVRIVHPLPEILDINSLDNCTVAVSLENGGAYVNDDGKMVMDLTVYTYEIYDMVDIAALAVNDIIVRGKEEVTVTEMERLESGLVRINGGLENGGFDLATDESTVYFEYGMDDAKAYYELGTVTLPVSTEFTYTDESDLEAEATVYYPGDFLVEDAGIVYDFTPYNTSIVIEDGVVVAMTKIYTP